MGETTMNKKPIMYLAGSMEQRPFEEVEKERKYIVEQLKSRIYIIDPCAEEKHKPGQLINAQSSGLDMRKICEMDLFSVELCDILFWYTGDIVSEGSEVEFAGGGWFNRWFSKGYFKKKCGIPKKLLIMVSKKRYNKEVNHFQNMWEEIKIFETVDKAITYLKRKYKVVKEC
jgi:hypothetical protein